MALHIILGMVAALLCVIFLRYLFGRNTSGLPGVDAVAGFFAVIILGLPLTAGVWAIIWMIGKISGKEVPSGIQVVGFFAAALIQWIIWSQLLAFFIRTFL